MPVRALLLAAVFSLSAEVVVAQTVNQDQATCSAFTGTGPTPQQQVDACTRLAQNHGLTTNDRAMA